MSRVKAIRERRGLTQEQLAHRSGISLRTLQGIESGRSNPRLATIQALASALGVKASTLVEDAA